MTVHDRLRQPGGARGVDHPERVPERHLLELGLVLVPGRAEIVPSDHAGRRRGLADEVDLDHGGQAGQGGGHLRGHLGPGVLLAVVRVSVAGDQDLRLDLGEPVDHAARAEIRRAGRPDRAQAGRGEQADDGLGDVRQQGDDAVPAADAEGTQPAGHPGHLPGEFTVAEAPGPTPFGIKDDGGAAGIGPRGPQPVTGVVQRGPGEPLDVRHDLAGQGRPVAAVAEHLEVVPHRGPEVAGLRHRPAPQVLIAPRAPRAPLAPLAPLAPGRLGQPVHEAGHPGVADGLGVRLPEDLAVTAAGQILHALSIVPSRRAWQRPLSAVVVQIM